MVVVNQLFATRYFGAEGAVGRRIRMAERSRARDHRRRPSESAQRPAGRAAPHCLPAAGPRLHRARLSGGEDARRSTRPRGHRAAQGGRDRRPRGDFPHDHARRSARRRPGRQSPHGHLVTVCGALAFLLAVVGIYGIVAYAVVRRTREIGVRVALGAQPGQVLGLIVREGGRVIGVGLAFGLVMAVASTRLLESMLYGISATDVRRPWWSCRSPSPARRWRPAASPPRGRSGSARSRRFATISR